MEGYIFAIDKQNEAGTQEAEAKDIFYKLELHNKRLVAE